MQGFGGFKVSKLETPVKNKRKQFSSEQQVYPNMKSFSPLNCFCLCVREMCCFTSKCTRSCVQRPDRIIGVSMELTALLQPPPPPDHEHCALSRI